MNVRVKLFARAKDAAGTDETELELPDGATVGDLRRVLAERHPGLDSIAPHLHVAIGHDYASDDAPVPADAEIACFPPVSGG